MTFLPGVAPPAIASAKSLWFLVQDSALAVCHDGERVRLPGEDEVGALGFDPSEAHYLGRLDGDDCFAMAAAGVELTVPFSVEGLRDLYGRLEEEVFAVAGRAVQIVRFGTTHRYCGRCGLPTVRHPKERCVHCPGCGLSCYPRISPAIIVLVRRGDEALLAHSARFASAFYSTLAGFVEPGESLEETLEREVREEVGISVTNIRYFGSQPWPFPHSLMIGFFADYAGGEIAADGREITDARWYSTSELPEIPPKLSIARKLIDTWIADVTGRDVEDETAQ
jgi:NAD+ diphosphatase